MKISCVSLRFWYSCDDSSSKRAMRALLLAWRPLGFWRTHSSSFLHRLLARGLGCFFLLQALLLLLQPGTVVAFPRNAVAAVEFENPFGRVVEEVAIVGDRHHGAGKFLQELLQPVDAFGIEVVGRLVEQQHVGLGQQQPAQRDAALLAAGQVADLGVPRRQAQRIGGDFQLVLGVGAAGGEDGFVLGLLGGELVEIGIRLGIGRVDLIELLLRLA